MFLRRRFSLSKNLPSTPINVYNKDDGGIEMESWRRDARREPVIADLDMLVPKDHLLRKIERVMGYQRLYERLEPYYCHDNGRPGTDPVVLSRWFSSSRSIHAIFVPIYANPPVFSC